MPLQSPPESLRDLRDWLPQPDSAWPGCYRGGVDSAEIPYPPSGQASRPAGNAADSDEDADRDALVVDIEPNVEHGCLLKSMYLETVATGSKLPD